MSPCLCFFFLPLFSNTIISIHVPFNCQFYKRELPASCISFAGKEGKAVFREALDEGTLECYFSLAEQFRTQSEPAYCGLGSLVMSLNALGTDPKRVWKGPWRWIDEEMLDCCSPLEVIKQNGLTMPEFSCLAMCNGASISTKYAQQYTEQNLREDVEKCSRKEAGVVLVASYNRAGLGQTGTGHFSPIGGYHPQRDLVLILDVARFKYPPHWVPLKLLYEAMIDVDTCTGKSRGWHLLEARSAQRPSMLHFVGHLRSEKWGQMLQQVKDAREKGDTALLECILQLSRSEDLKEVFPTLVTGVLNDRWHMVERIRALPVYASLPHDLPSETRLVIALLHEALCSTSGQSSPRDKPFQEELKGIANIVHAVEEFCCEKQCNTCHEQEFCKTKH